MSLRIGNQLFTQEALERDPTLLEVAFQALCNLPETPVSPVRLGKESLTKSILIKEKEMLIRHASDGRDKVGTGNQQTCCTLYAFEQNQQGDQGLIHVTHTGGSIAPFLSLFRRKKNVQAILVGGMMNTEENLTLSKNNIMGVLAALIDAAQEFTMISQRVLSSNKMTAEGLRDYVQEQLFENANKFYQKMFNRPVPDQLLSAFSSNDFIAKDIGESLLNDLTFYQALLTLSNSDLLLTPEEYQHFIEANKKYHFSVNGEKYLLNLLKALFSKQGFEVLEKTGFVKKLDEFPCLLNFVFDVHTKEIHRISYNHSEDSLRQLYIYDYERGSRYFMPYCFGNDIVPTLSQSFRDFITEIKPSIQRGILDDETFEKMKKMIHEDKESEHLQIFAELVLKLEKSISESNYTVCTQLWSWKTILSEPAKSSKGLSFSAKQI